MAYLELGGSFELRGYLVAIVTSKRGAAWCAWVEFEQNMEYGERFIHVPPSGIGCLASTARSARQSKQRLSTRIRHLLKEPS